MKFRVAKVRDGGRMDGGPDPRDAVKGQWRVTCILCRKVLGNYPTWDLAVDAVRRQFVRNDGDPWDITDLHVFSSCHWRQYRSDLQRKLVELPSTAVFAKDPGQPASDNDHVMEFAGYQPPKSSKDGGQRPGFGFKTIDMAKIMLGMPPNVIAALHISSE